MCIQLSYTTNFNYTDTVWGGLSIGCGKNLQRLQNRAARIVQGRSTTDEVFQKLGWINLQTQNHAQVYFSL